MSVPESIPAELIAGDTWRWTRSLGDYPATTWTATVYFENKDETFNAVGSASGSDFSFSIAAATSAGYKPGRYQWRLRVTDGSVTLTIESGWLNVLANPASTGKRDVRSWARRTLEAVEATLERKATADQLSMEIDGRHISRIPLAELKKFREELRSEIRDEDQASKSGRGRNVNARLIRV